MPAPSSSFATPCNSSRRTPRPIISWAWLTWPRPTSRRRRPDAEQSFQRALHLDAANGPALYDLGALLMTAGRAPEAGDVYRRLASLEEKRYRPMHAQYLYTAGRIPEAVAEFEKLAAAAPSDREARSRLIAAYVSVNRMPDAAKLLDAALKKNPKDVDARLERSRFLVRQGRYNDAQMDLN